MRLPVPDQCPKFKSRSILARRPSIEASVTGDGFEAAEDLLTGTQIPPGGCPAESHEA